MNLLSINLSKVINSNFIMVWVRVKIWRGIYCSWIVLHVEKIIFTNFNIHDENCGIGQSIIQSRKGLKGLTTVLLNAQSLYPTFCLFSSGFTLNTNIYGTKKRIESFSEKNCAVFFEKNDVSMLFFPHGYFGWFSTPTH